MNDDAEALHRLLGYHRRRYWLTNGWCLRFQVRKAQVTEGRPHGIRYSFTLHDVDMTRLLGIDNAHGIPRRQVFDHKHRFRRVEEVVPYDYRDADTLICDFFDEIENAFRVEGIEFSFAGDETELEEDDGEEVSE